MNILIHEPELLSLRGPRGFYSYFLSALVECAGAKATDEPRPLPRVTRPREHESAWIRCDGHLVCFDMSDHIQLFDLPALERADVYFKANLHRGVARRVLAEAGMSAHESKLVPFLFFADGLERFQRDLRLRTLFGQNRRRVDACHVVGVYENLVRDGGRSPFEHEDEPMTPAACHFWIRLHTSQVLQGAGIDGFYRLTSRGNAKLEDGVTVFPNLSRRAFSRRITDAAITIVNTLPHALFPWKVSESLTLGRPFVVEQRPVTEIPRPFAPAEGVHFLELMPGAGNVDNDAGWDDPAAYRALSRISLVRLAERADWLRGVLEDRERMAAMGESCRRFAEKAYAKSNVADYITKQVRVRVH